MKSKKCFLLLFVFLPFLTTLAQVDTAWVRRYNGSANDYDGAKAVAVDGSGNAYVTGYARNVAPTYRDFVTIKYAPNGDVLWVRSYNGPANDFDEGQALAVDASGNVYVTGYSSGGNATFDDYLTIKYNPNGDTLWVRRYNGANRYDNATDIEVDGSGNVYVTGVSQKPGGTGFDFDFATIKYSPTGSTIWVKRYDSMLPPISYDSATALAVDASGNVYVTGLSGSSALYFDYLTIKYNSNGDTLWVRRYNGPSNSIDEANALVLDGGGNLYVTGKESGATGDYATIKYAPNGDTLWVRRYNGPGNANEEANAIAIDSSGNVCVTGYSAGSGTSNDYATIKYAPNGDTLWVRRYNGPANSIDQAMALAFDTAGNLYVTGVGSRIGTSGDYATIKYAPNGDSLGVRFYNGPGNLYELPYGIAVDKCGYAYVTGYSFGSGTSQDYATIKYFPFPCTAKPGDANASGNVDIADVNYLVNYVFKGGPPPSPRCRGDVNANGDVLLTDIVYLINYVFEGGPAPVKCGECCL